jgi:hypothetical protein
VICANKNKIDMIFKLRQLKNPIEMVETGLLHWMYKSKGKDSFNKSSEFEEIYKAEVIEYEKNLTEKANKNGRD